MSPSRNCAVATLRLSSDHQPITITLNLTAEQLNGQKRLVWDWKKDNLPVITNEGEGQISQQ